MLSCLKCKSPLTQSIDQFICSNCGIVYPAKEGIFQFDRPRASLQERAYFPDHAFETLYRSEEYNFWFRVRNKIIGNTITRYLSPHSHVLDAGSGTGYVSQYLKKMGYHVVCADLFFEALQFCKERDAGDLYYQYNLSDQLFIEEFDGICIFDVLEHIDNDNVVLKNVHDALKQGGILFITVPADMQLWSAMDIYAEHKRRYFMQELREKVEGNGFKVITMSYFMTLLYPFIVLLRKSFLRTKNLNDEAIKNNIKKEIMNELQPNAIINALFYLVFSLEVPFMSSITLPFGSSLFCVAVKES